MSFVDSLMRYTRFVGRRSVTSLMLLFIIGCAQQPDLVVLRKFDEAERTFAAAQSTKDYLKAAALHQEVLDMGYQSGSVYFNQGNALFRAEQLGRAIAAYRQAERRMPRHPFVAANLKLAREAAGLEPETSTSVLNRVFFWQRKTSGQEKRVAVTILLAISLTCWLLRRSGQVRVVATRLSFAGGGLLIIAVLSAVIDWQQHDATQHAVLIDTTIARMGGSESYEPAFKTPIRAGTELTVVEMVGDWMHVQFNANTSAWVPRRATVRY